MRLLDANYVFGYVRTQIGVLKYLRLNEDCPAEMIAEAKIALEKLREHLDERGFKMPRPRYLYNHYDERTWQYVPTDVNNGHTRMYRSNPNFMYRAK